MKESDIVNAIALGIMASPEGFKTKLVPRTQFKLVFTKESPGSTTVAGTRTQPVTRTVA